MSQLYGLLNPTTGQLTDIGTRDVVGQNDVPVAAMPSSGGPFTYDAANQLAVLAVRVPRPIRSIALDIFALSGTLPTPAAGSQKANVIANLFGGNPPLWQLDTTAGGPILTAANVPMTQSNGSSLYNAAQQLQMAAIYCYYHPNYLVHPGFDSTINVAGDQPAN